MAVMQAVIIQNALEVGQDGEFFDVIATAEEELVCIVANDADPLITLRLERAEWEALNKLAIDEFRRQDLAKAPKGFDK